MEVKNLYNRIKNEIKDIKERYLTIIDYNNIYRKQGLPMAQNNLIYLKEVHSQLDKINKSLEKGLVLEKMHSLIKTKKFDENKLK